MSNKNRERRKTSRRKKGKPKTGSVSLEPCRKARTQTKKPKYLSLVHLEENQPLISFIQKNSENRRCNVENRVKQRKLNNLFPVRPEPGRISVVGEEDDDGRDMDTQYDNVSLLFDTTEEDNFRAITLNGLLDDESRSSDCRYKNETTTPTTTATITSEESPFSPSSLTFGYSFEDHEHTRTSAAAALVRTAMKGRITKEEGEEKWVVYSEVVEKKEMEEVSSCGGGGGDGDGGGDGGTWWSSSSSSKKTKLLALKLDYEEIMNAWSDKGPLYIEAEPPQTVPDLHILVDAWGTAVSNVWRVPEMVSNNVGGSLMIKEGFDGKSEEWKREHREASVLKYKEKRQNRLFSKRIRYEVRKVNAEKRPRLKGRFVKTD